MVVPNARRLFQVARWSGRAVAGLALLLLAYGAAGLVGGSLPRNAGWRPPDQGITIWVESNGIHTGLIMPKVAYGMDWRPFAPAADLADPRYGAHRYVAIGWGEAGFFLGTPRWRDVRLGILIGAALGSDRTLLHVEHVPRPVAGEDVRAVVLRPAEYRRLVALITATRVTGGRHWRGYGPSDIFYEGRGHYSPVRTCNSWTGDALAAAGVRVGRWTPFPVTVIDWFPKAQSWPS